MEKSSLQKSTNLLGIIQRSDKDTAELSEILKFLLGRRSDKDTAELSEILKFLLGIHFCVRGK